MSTMQKDIPQEEIARRAYELWQARGCPPGDGSDDWERAVAELKSARFDNGSIDGGFRNWWARVRQKIVGRDG